MNIVITLIIFLGNFIPPIIIRHDNIDTDYQTLAKQFEKKICHLNLGKNVPDGKGALIHKNWVLTAAHCAIEVRKKLIRNEITLLPVFMNNFE